MHEPLTEGWTWLYNATKWHYFREGRSLCGKWGLLGRTEPFEGDQDYPDNCRDCSRRRKKELEKMRVDVQG